MMYKNATWTRNFGILLAFLIIPPKHVGRCMLSQRINALPKSSSTPIAPLHRHTLEFETSTNSQHLRSRSFFCPNNIECCIKESRRKWVDKFSADQKRPPFPPPVWPFKICTNLTCPEILNLENVGFQLPKKERIISSSRPLWNGRSNQSILVTFFHAV
jgi:hypothetical protein